MSLQAQACAIATKVAEGAHVAHLALEHEADMLFLRMCFFHCGVPVNSKSTSTMPYLELVLEVMSMAGSSHMEMSHLRPNSGILWSFYKGLPLLLKFPRSPTMAATEQSTQIPKRKRDPAYSLAFSRGALLPSQEARTCEAAGRDSGDRTRGGQRGRRAQRPGLGDGAVASRPRREAGLRIGLVSVELCFLLPHAPCMAEGHLPKLFSEAWQVDWRFLGQRTLALLVSRRWVCLLTFFGRHERASLTPPVFPVWWTLSPPACFSSKRPCHDPPAFLKWVIGRCQFPARHGSPQNSAARRRIAACGSLRRNK